MVLSLPNLALPGVLPSLCPPFPISVLPSLCPSISQSVLPSVLPSLCPPFPLSLSLRPSLLLTSLPFYLSVRPPFPCPSISQSVLLSVLSSLLLFPSALPSLCYSTPSCCSFLPTILSSPSLRPSCSFPLSFRPSAIPSILSAHSLMKMCRDATHVWGKNRKTGNKYSCHQLPFPSYPNLFRPTSPQLSLIATTEA